MKKALSLFAGLALTGTAAFAQLSPGSTAPDWTFTDLNGNSWNLYTLLAQGKTVFIDVSATWCGPCWNYHNGHALRDLYNLHGPSGTQSQDVMVFYIEGDAATTVADLNGTGGNTQGDWVTGTPYPIIDPGASTNSFNSDYAIGYFPTIYKVCTDQKIYEVGQLPVAGLVSSINSCPFVVDAYPSAGPSPFQCATTFAPGFTLTNNGATTLTSATINYAIDGGTPMTQAWSGSLATGASATVSLPSQTFTSGAHTLDVTVTNPNGGTDNNNTNNMQTYNFTVNTAAGTASPLSNNFATASFPGGYPNWILSNPDAGITWQRVTTNGGSLKMDHYSYGSVGAIDEFVVEPIDLSAASVASLSFNVAHARYSTSYTDALEVLVSSDCGATWTSVWAKSGNTLATTTATTNPFTPTSAQWRAECIDMTPYAGQNKVFVMFRSTNGYGNNVYVDDISVTNAACAVGVAETGVATGLNLFPNPANTITNIGFNLEQAEAVTINVYNMVGELVSANYKGELAAGKQNVQISTEALANGMYMVELVAGNTRTVTRMTISH